MNTFREMLQPDYGQVFAVTEMLHRERTEYQEIMVFENPTFGRVLVLDGVVQLTAHDNHIYHEMMAHVPLLAHGAAQDVLIIGGGDGGTLAEVLKHPVESATVVELDPKVMEVSERYFSDLCRDAFRDPRTSFVVDEGSAYVATTDRKFDVILVDSTDPVGPGVSLFSPDFYRNCRSVLRDPGIICIQSGTAFYQPGKLAQSLAPLKETFRRASPFLAPVPTYSHGLLALIVAGAVSSFCPPASLLWDRHAKLAAPTRYYSPHVHRSAFAMVPVFRRDTMKPGAAAESEPQPAA